MRSELGATVSPLKFFRKHLAADDDIPSCGNIHSLNKYPRKESKLPQFFVETEKSDGDQDAQRRFPMSGPR
ncbi:MAG: hypothetical protein DMG09_23970 [Acidobacteria bacterium]|nr:MAG: hypothetical protein DMG09_23970 [Acidobacteriota bacterium]